MLPELHFGEASNPQQPHIRQVLGFNRLHRSSKQESRDMSLSRHARDASLTSLLLEDLLAVRRERRLWAGSAPGAADAADASDAWDAFVPRHKMP